MVKVLTKRKSHTTLLITVIAVFLSALTWNFYTDAATQKRPAQMPTLRGDAAVEYLKKSSTYESLGNAVAATVDSAAVNSPEAQTKLTGSGGLAGDEFGTSVAISGNTAIVGAPSIENPPRDPQGSAYIFVLNGTTWTEQQKLTPPDRIAGDDDSFGESVAISGNTVIVGAQNRGVGGWNDYVGAAYIFTRNGSTWNLQKKLTGTDDPRTDGVAHFGRSVAISGETVIIGSFGYLMRTDDQGEGLVHVFVRSGTTWTSQATLAAEVVLEDSRFGQSVAISGDTVVLGDPDYNASGARPGAAYVFVRSGTTWTQQQKLMPSDSSADNKFGHSVAVSAGTVIIGAPTANLVPRNTRGAAYVFCAKWHIVDSTEKAYGDQRRGNRQFRIKRCITLRYGSRRISRKHAAGWRWRFSLCFCPQRVELDARPKNNIL